MNDNLAQNAHTYASRYHRHLAERLGFGIHGIVYVAEGNPQCGKSAIKVHRFVEPYVRERRVYERLAEARVTRVLGFHLPQLLRADDDLLVLEMTVVTRPFVLDFAGAYLDLPPVFTEEIWAEWEAEKRDQFEARWPAVQAVLRELEGMEIYMQDVSPNNIAFVD
jgi:hypothetical protein